MQTLPTLADVRADTRRVQAEARARRELEAAGLAVFVSKCMTCGALYDSRLAQPCDGAVYNVSDGLCEPCLTVQAKAEGEGVPAW